MSTLKVGVVGCGNIFKLAHSKALKKLENVEVTACMDVIPERAEEGAELFNARAFTSFDEFLDTDIDVVEVLTPTFTHPELAIKALKAGRHVIVEKPLALNTEDGEKMIREAERRGLMLLVGHVRRFDKRWVTMKNLMMKRNFVPTWMKKSEVQRLPFPADYWYWDESKSGGVALDLGVHVVDHVRWFLNAEPLSVTAHGLSIREEAKVNNTYDHFVMMIEFDGGKTGVVEVSWAYPYPSRYGVFYHHVDVFGRNGRIRYVPMDTPMVGVVKGDFEVPRFSPLLSTYPEAFVEELRHFFACIEGLEEPRVTAHDALIAVEIVEKAVKSARTGRTERW